MEGVRGPLNAPFAQTIHNKENKAKVSGFADTLKSFLQTVNGNINAVDSKMKVFASGKQLDIHEAVIAPEKAGLSLMLLIQIRNKILEGYREIMKMQF